MQRIRIYICAAVFILLTACKVLLPQQALLLRERTHALLEHDDDYTGMITAVGRRLSELGIEESLIAAFGLDGTADSGEEAVETEQEGNKAAEEEEQRQEETAERSEIGSTL